MATYEHILVILSQDRVLRREVSSETVESNHLVKAAINEFRSQPHSYFQSDVS